MMVMTAQQIEAELAELDERIALARAPAHQVDVLQLQQVQRRREMLRAALKQLEVTSSKETDNGN
jgi:hypothetical protein